MPDDKNNVVVESQHAQNTGYSAEYVKELRDEAASWRTKLRDTETKYQTLESSIKEGVLNASIGEELKKRNITADPTWVKALVEGGNVIAGVDKFLEKYPQFAPSDSTSVIPKATQRAMPVKKENTNTQLPKVDDVQALKADPVARAKLRDQYRSMIGR
jgi:hypothetical protein